MMPQPTLTGRLFQCLDLIGAGASPVVYLCFLLSDNMTYARKYSQWQGETAGTHDAGRHTITYSINCEKQ